MFTSPHKLQHTLFSRINTYSLLFALLVVLVLAIARLSTLLIFGDLTDIQSNLSSLDDLFIVGLRFDLRIVGIVLVLLVYIPYLLLFWLKRPYLLQWVKYVLAFGKI